MIGFIITILGAYSAYALWSKITWLAVVMIIATLYQASSLNEMTKEVHGMQPEDRVQTSINMFSSIFIIGVFIYTFFI